MESQSAIDKIIQLGRRGKFSLSLLSLGFAIAVYVLLAVTVLTKISCPPSCPTPTCPMQQTESLGAEVSSNEAGQFESPAPGSSSKFSPEPTRSKASKVTSMLSSNPSSKPLRFTLKPPPATKRPSTCTSFPQYLAIYVHSAAKQGFRRELIRQTWGSPEVLKKLNATLVFILGQSENHKVTEAVAKEVQRYGDIVQGDFLDTYRNISLKALTGLEWVTTHCQHSRYLLKADDDIFVDVFALVRHLMTELDTGLREEGGVLLCNYWDSVGSRTPIRKPSKWQLSQEEYNQTLFPPFCQGAAYLTSPDVASALYRKSFSVDRVWLDDVYVTGLLRDAADISATRLNEAFRSGRTMAFGDLVNWATKGSPLFVHDLSIESFRELWRQLKKLERVRQLQIAYT